MNMRIRSGTMALLLAVAAFLAALPLRAQDDIENIDPKELIRQVEDKMRSNSSYSESTMEIVTPGWRRTLTMRSWESRVEDKSFIHILSPPRDQDTTFLRLQRELWSYLPRAERTIKIPPSMMLQNWMGSDFTHDDLVRESSYIEDYTHEYLGVQTIDGQECYVVALTPKPEAPVTWGRIEAAIAKDPLVPVRYRFYNRRGELRKVMSFSRVQEVQGRIIPTEMKMSTVGEEGHYTMMRIDKIQFDPDIPDKVFTRQFLRNPRL